MLIYVGDVRISPRRPWFPASPRYRYCRTNWSLELELKDINSDLVLSEEVSSTVNVCFPTFMVGFEVRMRCESSNRRKPVMSAIMFICT